MDNGNDLQHAMMVLGAAMGIAALGTAVFSLLGKWIGGSWTTLLAIIAALVFSYEPLLGGSLFTDFKTDILHRIVLAAIPAAALLIGLSFKQIPWQTRLITAVIVPALMLWFAFANHPIDRHDLWMYKVLPVSMAILAAWALIEPISVRTPGVSVPLIAGCFTGTAAMILQSSVENQAARLAPMIPATAAGALLAALIAALMKKPLSFARGPVLLWLTLIGTIYAFVLADTTLDHLCYLAAIPLLAWLCEIPVIHRLKPWKREAIRFALMAIPMGVVMFQVYKELKQMATEM